MRKRQPQQLFKTKCHRGISFAGSWPVQDCFSHSLSHLAQECGLGKPAVGGRAGRGGGDRRGGPCRCPSCPPSPRTSSWTRPLDLFIHQTHLLEIEWAGLCLFSSGPGGRPGHVTIKGRREETPVGGGEGPFLAPTPPGWLTGPSRQGPKPGLKSARQRPAPRPGRPPSAPLTTQREVPSAALSAAGTCCGPPRHRDRNFPRGPHHESHTGQAAGGSPSRPQPGPASPVEKLFSDPREGWRSLSGNSSKTNVFKLGPR